MAHCALLYCPLLTLMTLYSHYLLHFSPNKLESRKITDQQGGVLRSAPSQGDCVYFFCIGRAYRRENSRKPHRYLFRYFTFVGLDRQAARDARGGNVAAVAGLLLNRQDISRWTWRKREIAVGTGTLTASDLQPVFLLSIPRPHDRQRWPPICRSSARQKSHTKLSTA